MRHSKTVTNNFIGGPQCRPCEDSYKFNNPNPDRVYVKVLKFVDEHPGCKRDDIQFGVWGNHNKSNSGLFAQMLYANILDYNTKYEYKVTRKGKNILRKVAKMVG